MTTEGQRVSVPEWTDAKRLLAGLLSILLVILLPVLNLGLPYLLGLAAVLFVVGCLGVFIGTTAIGSAGPLVVLLVSSALSVPLVATFTLIEITWLVLPAALLAASVGVYRLRKDQERPLWHRLSQANSKSPPLVSYLAVAVLLLVLVGFLTGWSPLSFETNYRLLAADVPLFSSIVDGLAAGDGLQAPFASNLPLRYHWLAYGWAAWIHSVSGLGAIAVIVIALPLWVTALALLAALELGRSSSTSALAPVLSVIALAFAGGVGVWRYTELSPWEWFSPSTLMGGALGLVGILLFLNYFSTPRLSWILTLTVIGFASVTAKASMGLILAATLILFAVTYSRYWSSSTRRAWTGAVATSIGVTTGYAIFLFGNNNELFFDTTLAQMLTSGPREALSILGVHASFIFAPLFLWGGLLLVVVSGSTRMPAYRIALIAGISGQVAFLLLAAPDYNDRFISAAGLTLSVPILAGALADSLTEVSRRRLFIAVIALWVLPTSLVLGLAAWSPYFEIRPLFLIVLVIALIVTAGILLLSTARSRRSLRGFLASVGVAAMVLALVFPIFEKVFDQSQVSTEAGFHTRLFTRSAGEGATMNSLVHEISRIRMEVPQGTKLAITGPDDTPSLWGRWALYEWRDPVFTTYEADLDRLLSRNGTVINRQRRDLVQGVLDGKAEAIRKACDAGLNGVLSVTSDSSRTLPTYESEMKAAVTYTALACEASDE